MSNLRNALTKQLVTALLIFGAAGAAEASIRAVPSCARIDVQNAINASIDGDTISVPACNEATATSARWTSPVVIENKRITIQGAGIDRTVLRLESGTYLFHAPSTNTKSFTITGFTFRENAAFSCDYSQAPKGQCAPISVSGGNGFIIHGNSFIGSHADTTPSAIYVNNNVAGLVHSNTFDNWVLAVYPYGVDTSDGAPNSAWTRESNLGDGSALYVESNTIKGGSFHCVGIEAEEGASYVFRYNTVTGCQGAGSHGPCQSGGRGVRRTEVYHNTITSGGVNNWTGIYIMGGTGVIFGNTLIGWEQPILFQYKRSCDISSCTQKYQNLCDNTPDANPPLDGNIDGTGYPCLDQVGRGRNQQLEPYYEWNNCLAAASCLDGVACDCGGATKDADPWVNTNGGCTRISSHIKLGRDYFSDIVPSGYVPLQFPHPLRSGASVAAPSHPMDLSAQ